jgi:hypothetical protein
MRPSSRGFVGAFRENPAELADEDPESLVPAGRWNSLPERLRELVPRHGHALFSDEIGEEEAPLPTGQVPLIQDDSVSFDGDSTREKDLQLALLTHL